MSRYSTLNIKYKSHIAAKIKIQKHHPVGALHFCEKFDVN